MLDDYGEFSTANKQKNKIGLLFTVILIFVTIPLIISKLFGQSPNDQVTETDTTSTVPEITINTPTPEVLALSIDLESTTSASPTAQVTPKYIPTPTPQITPDATPSSQVNQYIDLYANQYGISPDVLRYMALCESGFKSNATNGIYVGLFQFAPISWSNIRIEMGENPDIYFRYFAKDSIQTAAYALSKGKQKMWPNCIP